jgi:predicted nuclease of predicted toxin-antitoxin system
LILWIDAQISPSLAPWIEESFGVSARPVRDLGLLHASDQQIFSAARDEGATVLTKDRDFVHLLDRLGPPPQVLWVTCGNTSNARLKEVLSQTLPPALNLLRGGERLVEISDAL